MQPPFPHLLAGLSVAAATFLFTPARANETEETWTRHCAKCHGPDGQANTRMGRKYNIKSLVAPAEQAKLSDDDILKAISEGARDKEGEEKMPAFKEKLSEPQRSALVGYVRRLKRDPSANADGTQ
jgi:mono/diheme cytochrome c family protein